jgi:type 1 glutamine amidotransferase
MFVFPSRRVVLLCLLSLTLGAAHAEAQRVKKVLFFTKSSGYEHSVIKEVNGQPSFAGKVLTEIGPKYGIEFTLSKDGSKFTPAYLAQFDAFFFYTTGDLTKTGTDGNPAMTPEGKAALLAAVAGGKGFIGAHSATDTFHAPEAPAGQPRYRNLGPKADSYTRMLGAEFILHGDQQMAHLDVVDRAFPGLTARGAGFDLTDEWYSMADFSPDLHVLLAMDTSKMGNPDRNGANSSYSRPPFPSTWARKHGQGRVFYTAMGHREDVWTNPLFQQILMGGISWAVGNLDVDISPNLSVATPRSAELPPEMPVKK